jgi:hypothetical protein
MMGFGGSGTDFFTLYFPQRADLDAEQARLREQVAVAWHLQHDQKPHPQAASASSRSESGRAGSGRIARAGVVLLPPTPMVAGPVTPLSAAEYGRNMARSAGPHPPPAVFSFGDRGSSAGGDDDDEVSGGGRPAVVVRVSADPGGAMAALQSLLRARASGARVAARDQTPAHVLVERFAAAVLDAGPPEAVSGALARLAAASPTEVAPLTTPEPSGPVTYGDIAAAVSKVGTTCGCLHAGGSNSQNVIGVGGALTIFNSIFEQLPRVVFRRKELEI